MVSSTIIDPTPVIKATPRPATNLGRLKFTGGDSFLRELRRRVDAYFNQTGYRRRDNVRMYLKTATILSWFVASYLLLLLVATHWWSVIPLAISMGLSVAAIGFNIQHDGGHKAYSQYSWVNRLMAFSIDVVGGSSYLWDWKHNSIHHTFPNVDGQDDDINIGFLGRLSPVQPRLWFHRFQALYLWLLYGFLAVKWHLFDDFRNLATGYIGPHKIPRPKGKDLALFILGKVIFFSIAFVIPLCLHSFLAVAGVYLLAAIVSGIVMSVVFQLAHCVDAAEFPVPVQNELGQSRLPTEWAVHQIQTTVDFARGNGFLCWFLGGLNFQIEHHLLHKICHVHYPALSKIVEDACHEFGIQYRAHRTFLSAVASHFRWLVQMGRPGQATLAGSQS